MGNILDPEYDFIDATNTSEPKKPKVKSEADPVTPDNEQGWASAIGTGIARGGLGVGNMFLQAASGVDKLVDRYIQAEPENDPDNWDLKQWAHKQDVSLENYKNKEFKPATEGLKGTVAGGVESVVTSLGTKVPGAVLGALAAPALGVTGTMFGSVAGLGAAMGYIGSGIPLFGAAQYDTATRKYTKMFEEQGHDKVKARNMAELPSAIESMSEMLTEGVSDLLDMAFVGEGTLAKGAAKEMVAQRTLEQLLKGGVYKSALKSGAGTFASETIGETLNSVVQGATEEKYGRGKDLSHVMNDPEFWSGIGDQMGRIAVSSLIFAGMAGGGHIHVNNTLANDLINAGAPKEKRLRAAAYVHDELAKESKPIADAFYQGAWAAIQDGQDISSGTELDQLSEEMINAPGDMARRIANGMEIPTEEELPDMVENWDGFQEGMQQERETQMARNEMAGNLEDQSAWMAAGDQEYKENEPGALIKKRDNLQELLGYSMSQDHKTQIKEDIAAIDQQLLDMEHEGTLEADQAEAESNAPGPGETLFETQKEAKQAADGKEGNWIVYKGEDGYFGIQEVGKKEKEVPESEKLTPEGAAKPNTPEEQAAYEAEMANVDREFEKENQGTPDAWQKQLQRDAEDAERAAVRAEEDKAANAQELRDIANRRQELHDEYIAKVDRDLAIEQGDVTPEEKPIPKEFQAQVEQDKKDQIGIPGKTPKISKQRNDAFNKEIMKAELGVTKQAVRGAAESPDTKQPPIGNVSWSERNNIREGERNATAEINTAVRKAEQSDTIANLETELMDKGLKYPLEATDEDLLTSAHSELENLGGKKYAMYESSKDEPGPTTREFMTDGDYYPAWFSNKGWTAKNVKASIKVVLSGKGTAKQKALAKEVLHEIQIDRENNAYEVSQTLRREAYEVKYSKAKDQAEKKKEETEQQEEKKAPMSKLAMMNAVDRFFKSPTASTSGLVQFHNNSYEANMALKAANPEHVFSRGAIKGYYDPITNTINIVKGATSEAAIHDVLRHEGVHFLIENDATFKKEFGKMKSFAKGILKGGAHQDKALLEKARDQVEKFDSERSIEGQDEELIAYYLEFSKGQDNLPLRKRIINSVKRAMVRMGFSYKSVGMTGDDIGQMVTESLRKSLRKNQDNNPRQFAVSPKFSQTEAINQLEQDKNFVRWYADSQAKEDDGSTLTVLHSGPHDVSYFHHDGDPNGYYGGEVTYFTDGIDDSNSNYARPEGPDFTARLQSRAEELADDDMFNQVEDMSVEDIMEEYGADRDLAERMQAGSYEALHDWALKEAEAEFNDLQFNTMPMVLSIKNPVRLDWENPTYFDMSLKYDDDVLEKYEAEAKVALKKENPGLDEDAKDYEGYLNQKIKELAQENGEDYSEESGYMKMYNAVQQAFSYYDVTPDLDDLMGSIPWQFDGEDSVSASEFEDHIRREAPILYDDYGELVSPGTLLIDIYKELGYDGVIIDAGATFGPQPGPGGFRIAGMDNVQGVRHYHTFQPNQAKSIFNRKFTEDKRVMYSTGGWSTELPALVNSKQWPAAIEAGKLDKWLDKRIKSGAIPSNMAEEMEWNGFRDFVKEVALRNKGLDEPRKFTKQDAQKYMTESRVKLVPIEKKAHTYLDFGEFETAEHPGYRNNAPFGYRVFSSKEDPTKKYVMNLAEKGETPEQTFKRRMEQGNLGEYEDPNTKPKFEENYTEEGGTNYQETLLTLPGNDYVNTAHFDEEGIVVHIRTNERVTPAGEGVYFVEEVQSDLHQAGKEEGYEGSDNIEDMYKEASIFGRDNYVITTIGGKKHRLSVEEGMPENEVSQFFLDSRNAVPDAPFKDTWHLLGMKQAIKQAVAADAKYVAWTTGKQQADRYKLTKVVRRIEVGAPHINGKDKIVYLVMKGGEPISLLVDPDGMVIHGQYGKYDGEKLSSVVGKDLAKKIMSNSEKHELSGLDLEIGGEGMVEWYDRKIPNTMKKYLKKYKVKISKVDAQTSELNTGFEITPELKSAVESGLPMFSQVDRSEQMHNIKDEKVLSEAFNQAAFAGQEVFNIDPGNGSGKAQLVNGKWQANRPIEDYVKQARRFYGQVTVKGNKITAKNPRPEGESMGGRYPKLTTIPKTKALSTAKYPKLWGDTPPVEAVNPQGNNPKVRELSALFEHELITLDQYEKEFNKVVKTPSPVFDMVRNAGKGPLEIKTLASTDDAEVAMQRLIAVTANKNQTPIHETRSPDGEAVGVAQSPFTSGRKLDMSQQAVEKSFEDAKALALKGLQKQRKDAAKNKFGGNKDKFLKDTRNLTDKINTEGVYVKDFHFDGEVIRALGYPKDGQVSWSFVNRGNVLSDVENDVDLFSGIDKPTDPVAILAGQMSDNYLDSAKEVHTFMLNDSPLLKQGLNPELLTQCNALDLGTGRCGICAGCKAAQARENNKIRMNRNAKPVPSVSPDATLTPDGFATVLKNRGQKVAAFQTKGGLVTQMRMRNPEGVEALRVMADAQNGISVSSQAISEDPYNLKMISENFPEAWVNPVGNIRIPKNGDIPPAGARVLSGIVNLSDHLQALHAEAPTAVPGKPVSITEAKSKQEYFSKLTAMERDMKRVASKIAGDKKAPKYSYAPEHVINPEEMQDIIDISKSNGTHMTAPNGEKSNLPEHLWAQVRTTAFKNWFGDWLNDPANASKIVDDKGEPRVVYHGADDEGFYVFKDDNVGIFSSQNWQVAKTYSKNSDTAEVIPESGRLLDLIDRGEARELTPEEYHEILDMDVPTDPDEKQYFESQGTDSFYTDRTYYAEEILENYAPEGSIYDLFINMKNPMTIDWGGNYWNEGPQETVYEVYGANPPQYHGTVYTEEEAKTMADEIDGDYTETTQDIYQNTDDAAMQARSMDFDGIIYENIIDHGGRGDWDYPETNYAVFDNTSVKSAGGNDGTFGKSNPDIRYSQTDEKNLITVHNLSADNLLHASDLGGLAAPSLAVIRSDKNDFNSFGEISLVVNPEVLNDRKTKTYDADIYTPRHPPVTEVIDRKEFNALEAQLEAIPTGVLSWAGTDISGLSDGPGTLRNLRYKDGIKYLYLDSIGKLPRGIKNIKSGYETSKKLTNKIAQHKAGFDKFTKDLEEKLVSDRKIFKGYTPSGNRRHAPYNLTNIVKEMTRKLKGGEDFNYGAGSVRAQYAKSLPSVSAIQKNRDKIVSGADFDTLKEESNKAFMTTLEKLQPYYKYDAEGMRYWDDASSAISEGYRGLNEAFNMDKDAWALVNDLTNMLTNMPTAYFEAKVQRAMDLSEFTGAAVPYGTSKDAIKVLKDNGITIRYYKEGDTADRSRAVKGFKSAKFSQTEGDPNAGRSTEENRSFAVKIFEKRNSATLGVDILTRKMETDIQRLAGDVRKPSLLSSRTTKDTQKGRDLSMAMMIYRDLGGDVARAEKFIADAQKRISGKMKKVERDRLQRKIRIVKQSLNLSGEQKKYVDTDIDKLFGQVATSAIDAGIIKKARENYVRRMWDFPDDYNGSGQYGFKMFSTASQQRTLDTILDGWDRGYELKAEGIQSAYNNIATEIANIRANQEFIVQGRSTLDLEGNPLMTTKQLDGYQKLEASGLSAWVMIGDVKPGEDYGDLDAWLGEGKFELEVNGYGGKKAFLVKPDNEEAAKVFEKQQLYAPAELASFINKMTAGDNLFSSTPAMENVKKLNNKLKGWILLSSFFHHMAGARSWFYGVNHGWKGGAWNPVKAHKAGLVKIDGANELLMLGVKHGLTLGRSQDFDEYYAKEPGIIAHVLEKLDANRTLGAVQKLEFQREKFTNSLFKRFFAGLKAEAFSVEFTHELAKNPSQDQAKLAERVATLINEDFGGLHLQRMGRNPTIQNFARLLLLSPDWTESNFRTFFGIVGGDKINKWVGKMIGDVPPPPGMEKHYRKFWARVAVRGIAATIIMQMFAGAGDPEDKEEFYKEQFGSFDQFRRLRWTQVEVSDLYEAMGIDLGEDQRKTFSFIGHFADPLKLMTPDRLIKGKGSPVVRLAEAGFSGSDWADRPFTGVKELIETGKTIKKSRFQKKEEMAYRVPSYLINQLISMQPIQLGYMLKWMQGEEDGMSAVMSSMGAHVSNAWIPDTVGDKYAEIGKELRKIKRDSLVAKTAGEKVKLPREYYHKYRLLSRAQSRIRKKNKALARATSLDLQKKIKADIQKIKQEFITKIG